MRPKRRILCVDPAPLALSVRACLLETRGNYVVTSVESSADAVRAFRSKPFDIVVSTLVLDEGDGDELARRIKALAPEVPVVLITPYSVSSANIRYADALLGKGYNTPQDLLERVRIIVARKRGPKKQHPQPVTVAVPQAECVSL